MQKKSKYIVLNKVPCWLTRQYQYWKYVWYKRWKFVTFEFIPLITGLLILIDSSCWKFDYPLTWHNIFRNTFSSVGAFFDCHVAKLELNFENVVGIILLLISLLAYILGYLEYLKMIKDLSIYRKRNYKDINFEEKEWALKSVADNFLLVNEKFNKAFRNHLFSNRPVELKENFKLNNYSRRELAWRGLEYFRREHKVLWNDKKVRLHMSINDMLKSNKNSIITLMKTNYFDYLGTGYYSMKSWFDNNEEIYNGISLIYDESARQIKGLTEAQTAHHIGVNALLITKDKKFIIQKTNAPAAPDEYAPSGSGSLDINDISDKSFEETLLNGALREFAQETGWAFIRKHSGKKKTLEDIENFKKIPLGMSIDISRGMITDFFFLILTENSSSSDYMEYYKDRLVRVDKFEVSLKNAMHPVNIVSCCNTTITKQEIKVNLEEIKKDYQQCAMLTMSIDFICALLEENSEQSKYLVDFLNKPLLHSPL